MALSTEPVINHSRRRLFGAAVFVYCCFLSCAAPAQDGKGVTVCAYNLRNWLLQEPLDRKENSVPIAKPDTEKARVVESLCQIQPDILGICEIGSEGDLTDLQRRLKAVGVDLPHHELTRGADPTRSLALLSRFPIVARNHQVELHYQIGRTKFLMQRGILDATVKLPDSHHLRLIGAHLKSKRAVAEADETLMRRNEAHLLRRHLDDIFAQDPAAKLICYGDFNEHRNAPAINEIIGSRASDGYMSEVSLKDDHGLVWTHFWDAADVYSRFDYFFVSRPVRPLIDTKASYIFTDPNFLAASDHRPIVVRLRNAASAKP